MNERLLSLAVLGCCLLTLATAAGSIDSAVGTDPDDAVDYESGLLPVGEDRVGDIKRQLQGRESSTNDGGTDDGQSSSSTPAPSGESSQNAAAESGDGGEDAGERGPGDRRQQVPDDEGQPGTGSGPGGTDGWLDWLRSLLQTLLRFAPGLLLLALSTAVYRHRDRLRRRLAALRDRFADEQAGDSDGGERERPTPSNPVEVAWYRTMAEFDLAADRSRTPEECARQAVERGAARAAIEPLTEVFTEVRYGDEPVTQGRQNRAEESLRLCLDTHSEGP